ncbi:MAG: hypothetical protein GY716_20875 [bacterium]|nr:hypothetical protein [bacterium]
MDRVRRIASLGLRAVAVCLVTLTSTVATSDAVDWCETHERWAATRAADAFAGQGCGTLGPCDLPEVRDLWVPDESSPLWTVRLKFNILAEDDGSGALATQFGIDGQLQQLNTDFLPSRIQFVAETEFIHDSTYVFPENNQQITEMKQLYADRPDEQLNIWVVGLLGLSYGTFPWGTGAVEAGGGIVMSVVHFGAGRSLLTHEVGHNLGLWHTHRGVSEVADCSDCYEEAGGFAGDTTGDLAADTPPTPTNLTCGDPQGSDPCSGSPWAPTDFTNYMGYAPDGCYEHFSTAQRGRMRCWFDQELTGWLGDPLGMSFSYPQGLPVDVAPGQPHVFRLQLNGALGVVPLPGSAEMFVSIDGAAFTSVPATHLGDDLYELTLPAATVCGDTLEYYVTALSTAQQPFFDPPGAPVDAYAATASFGSRVLLQETFEGDVSGWTVIDDPSLTGGGWEQAAPEGTSVMGVAAAPDAPSAATRPNTLAFVTENGAPGAAANAADVDGGPTDLISPAIDLQGSDATITYSRWFYTDGDDKFTVWVTADGNDWQLVEALAGAHNSWQTATFKVSDLVSPSATVQVRFRAVDEPDNSITEAAIDLFRVDEFVCSACGSDIDCQGQLFCDGDEQCVGGFCFAGSNPCPGRFCNDLTDSCVDCFSSADCADALFCNGEEICDIDLCTPGGDPCPGAYCLEESDSCAECFVSADCDDGLFCNGVEACVGGGSCVPGPAPCPAVCDETSDSCIGNVIAQPSIGAPLPGLTPDEEDRFGAGKAAFEQVLDEAAGLGPAYNAASCAACHTTPVAGAWGTTPVTRFGLDGSPSVDPLTELGGPVLQTEALDPSCLETVPPQADVIVQRRPVAALGAGLVDALADDAIESRALNPPSGVSGRVHRVDVLEQPGPERVGRFGWKSEQATLLSMAAESALQHLGLSNRLLPQDLPPNGDVALLALCDGQADPEDGPDGDGFDFIDRVSDYLRYLAPPPQTPQSGMTGETFFALAGCSSCHAPLFTTPSDGSLPLALRDRTLKPYSDFLLHDMGTAADMMGQGDALDREMRTPPLWGLRWRETLWHDGRFGGSFADRVLAAIAAHDAPGSEAASSAQNFQSLPQSGRDATLVFLGSLGRAEFDLDGDNDVDAADHAALLGCFTGPGSFYSPNDACAVSDVDQDGDVDDDDLAVFELVAHAPSGEVPSGVASPPLRLEKLPGGDILLSWSSSCLSSDDDYAAYRGTLGQWGLHDPIVCSTGGSTAVALTPQAGDAYFVVVPSNGYREGSYGRDGAGLLRQVSPSACLPQSVEACP